MESKIRFLSLNIGLKNNLAGLSTLLTVHKLDVVLLQEVRISDEQVEQLI
jgi:exonuclease III